MNELKETFIYADFGENVYLLRLDNNVIYILEKKYLKLIKKIHDGLNYDFNETEMVGKLIESGIVDYDEY